MNRLSQAMVIARRDFIAIVVTPTFLLFLLAPLLMLSLSALGGLTAAQMTENAGSREKIVAVLPEAERAPFIAADRRLRTIAGGGMGAPLLIVAPGRVTAQQLSDWRRDPDVLAIMEGGVAAPAISQRRADSLSGRYLAAIAHDVAYGRTDVAPGETLSNPRFTVLPTTRSGRTAQSGLGYAAVFVIFLLTLLLAGQTVGMLAEEKGNKVIEILAAAAPLEAVFFGKLIGMLGVALLFIGFWGAVIGGLGAIAIASVPIAQLPPEAASLLNLKPAIGWGPFILFGLLYFLLAFLLLGTVFLGVGAQASTVREIQMLSLPITFFQIGMFVLGSAAANLPGSGVAQFGSWLPWSSPFAMAARGATDAALLPHLGAIAWQCLWIAISIRVAVRLFRAGVLRTGSFWSWLPWQRRERAPEAA